MKTIKTIAYVIVAIVVIGLGYKFYKFINPGITTSTVTTDADTSFHAVAHDTYRPASIPFVENPVKPKVNLPSNVKEKDVEKVLTVVKSPNDSTQIIFTKDGNIHVSGQGGKVLKVEVTTYLDPILAFGLFPKIGIDANTIKISPVVGIAFLEIYGRLQLPVFSLDFQGIGAGADFKIFDPVNIGLMLHNNWDTSKDIRLSLVYSF
jgi:hypothetical protein